MTKELAGSSGALAVTDGALAGTTASEGTTAMCGSHYRGVANVSALWQMLVSGGKR